MSDKEGEVDADDVQIEEAPAVADADEAAGNDEAPLTNEEAGEGPDLDKLFFQNIVLRKYADMKAKATDMRLTWMRCLLATMSVLLVLFNTYSIVSNWMNNREKSQPGAVANITSACGSVLKEDPLGTAKDVSTNLELGFIIALWVYGIVYLTSKAYISKGFTTLRGEVSGAFAEIIQRISTFSLVKGLDMLKPFAGVVADTFVLYAEEPCGKGIACFVSFGKFLWVIGAVVAFVLKLSQVAFVANKKFGEEYTTADWIALANFLNAMIGLYKPAKIQTNAMFKFMFAGSDAKYTTNERDLQREFVECINDGFCRHGMIRGIAIILTLGPADVQQILLQETEEVQDCGEIDDAA